MGVTREAAPVSVDLVGAPGLFPVQLRAPSEPEYPEVPRVVDFRLCHDALGRIEFSGLAVHQVGDILEILRGVEETAQGGEVEQAHADGADEFVERLAVRGGGRGLICALVVVLEVAPAHEVQLVLPPSGARRLARHDEVDIRALGHPHPVHPGDLRTEVLAVAAPGRAVEEDAGPVAVHAPGLLRGEGSGRPRQRGQREERRATADPRGLDAVGSRRAGQHGRGPPAISGDGPAIGHCHLFVIPLARVFGWAWTGIPLAPFTVRGPIPHQRHARTPHR